MNDLNPAWRSPQEKLLDVVRGMTFNQRQEMWNMLTEPLRTECTCGFGGFHDDNNPRCERNKS